jgi:hypothetical protein
MLHRVRPLNIYLGLPPCVVDCGLFSEHVSHPEGEMFEAPVRKDIQGTQGFYIRLKEPQSLQARFEVTTSGIVPELRFQSQFQSMQNVILSNMVKHTQLFKVPPTLESLQAITPNWGFVWIDGAPKQSEYTQIDLSSLNKDQLPSFADLTLVGVSITRTTIRPYFEAKYLESASDSMIDFQWDATPNEVEEVSDISNLVDPDTMQLKDPALVKREKMAEKERVRNAFRAAEQAKHDAEAMAEEFYTKYDLSDAESELSEWISDASEEDESS